MAMLPSPPAHDLLARAIAVVLAGAGACSCSLLVDWTGYSGAADAGDAAPTDAAAETSVPRCSAANCGGCCTSQGFCAGGQSAATCGTGAGACKDCQTSGRTCSAGSCVAPLPDAAPPPPCSPSSCSQFLKCIPAIQIGCCKPDNTCGCAYVPAPGVPQGCN